MQVVHQGREGFAVAGTEADQQRGLVVPQLLEQLRLLE